MWSPICDIVELERPLLKEVYLEIEKLFNVVMESENKYESITMQKMRIS